MACDASAETREPVVLKESCRFVAMPLGAAMDTADVADVPAAPMGPGATADAGSVAEGGGACVAPDVIMGKYGFHSVVGDT